MSADNLGHVVADFIRLSVRFRELKADDQRLLEAREAELSCIPASTALKAAILDPQMLADATIGRRRFHV